MRAWAPTVVNKKCVGVQWQGGFTALIARFIAWGQVAARMWGWRTRLMAHGLSLSSGSQVNKVTTERKGGESLPTVAPHKAAT